MFWWLSLTIPERYFLVIINYYYNSGRMLQCFEYLQSVDIFLQNISIPGAIHQCFGDIASSQTRSVFFRGRCTNVLVAIVHYSYRMFLNYNSMKLFPVAMHQCFAQSGYFRPQAWKQQDWKLSSIEPNCSLGRVSSTLRRTLKCVKLHTS